MSNIKKYRVEHVDLMCECEIEIDFSYSSEAFPTMLDQLKERVEFFSGWEGRLSDNDGDYVQTFIKQLSKLIFRIATGERYNAYGIREELKEYEGYGDLESCGINITYVSEVDFYDSDLEVEIIN